MQQTQIDDVKNKDADLAKAKEQYEYMVKLINTEAEVAARVLQEKINQNEEEMTALQKQYNDKVKEADESLKKIETNIKMMATETQDTEVKKLTIITPQQLNQDEIFNAMAVDCPLASNDKTTKLAMTSWFSKLLNQTCVQVTPAELERQQLQQRQLSGEGLGRAGSRTEPAVGQALAEPLDKEEEDEVMTEVSASEDEKDIAEVNGQKAPLKKKLKRKEARAVRQRRAGR